VKQISLPDDYSELDGDGVSAFTDEGDDQETLLIVTPNQWGSENRDGVISLVMQEGLDECAFQVPAHQIPQLLEALGKAATNSY